MLTTDFGLNLSGWTLTSAFAVSDDGKAIIGKGTNAAGKTEGWIAMVPEPSGLGAMALATLNIRRFADPRRSRRSYRRQRRRTT